MAENLPKVGIFDSGVGGLTVLMECFCRYPAAEYYYLGDNERAPYGNRSKGEICSFVREAMKTFASLGVDAAVLACNTATAVCIEEMRREFSFPIIGTEPAVRLAARECKSALVLATVQTAASERLFSLLRASSSCEFTVLPCPHLAAEIELALHGGGGIGNSVHFPSVGGRKFDGVVLGCTHYVFFKDKIAAFYGCKTFDGNRGVAEELNRRIKIGNFVHGVLGENQNICFEKKMKILAKKRVFFLGKCRDLNRNIFFTNICFNLF